ncbi:MAG: serine hydrolase domain-containing protein [Gammaproteobacteria bacterium]
MFSLALFAATLVPQPVFAGLPAVNPGTVAMDAASLQRIDGVVTAGIARGDFPGAVIAVGRHGRVVFQRAYGDRIRVPQRQPMQLDTLFDIASLTQVVLTAPAIMQLVEDRRLRLSDRLGQLIPECGQRDRRAITVRQLLAHESGLRANFTVETRHRIGSYDDAIGLACAEPMIGVPGMQFRYSDLNYVLLGEILRRATGELIDAYGYRHILQPLGMQDTLFNPSAALRRERIAGEDVVTGQVEDGVATRMGGISGHSGLYSTAADLAVYCAMILNDGEWQGVRVLSRDSVHAMTRAVVHHARGSRGLGFDVATGYSGSRGDLFPCDSFGHTGYSGVSIWLDHHSDTFVIVLTNRLHPNGRGDVRALRESVATIAAQSLTDIQYARAENAPENSALRCRAGRG